VDRQMKQFILDLLQSHNIMSFATVRADGFPQATSVVYASEGLTLYFACDLESQKARNIARSPKVSLTINHDYEDWNEIRGLSLAGLAELLTGRADRRRAWRALAAKFPAMAAMTEAERAAAALVRVRPKVISVIDYQRGIGHTDLVRVGGSDAPARPRRGATRRPARATA